MKEKIVGIASLPDRVNCLEKTIYSLYDQVDKIIVGLNNYDSIPFFLNLGKIECYLLDNKLGDAAKFYKIDSYKNHYYFACDDDIVYPPDYCQIMIEKSEKYKSLVGLHGINVLKPVKSYYRNREVYHVFSKLDTDVEVDIVATSTCLIDTSILNISLSKFPIPNMADIWLADEAKKQKVKSFVIQKKENWVKYCDEMRGKWTIYDDFKNKSDYEQTKIVSNWETVK